jgi:Holliday junction resolvase RusA-like endonuclease
MNRSYDFDCQVTADTHGRTPLITIRCPGVPVAQPRQRQRVITVAGRVMAANYTPTKSPVNDFKAALKYAASQAYSGPPLTTPLRVDVTCVFPRPSNVVWKSKPMTRLPHAKKPDRDNLEKSIFDALNNIIWRDDAQIYEGGFLKVIAAGDEQPHVLIEVFTEQAK